MLYISLNNVRSMQLINMHKWIILNSHQRYILKSNIIFFKKFINLIAIINETIFSEVKREISVILSPSIKDARNFLHRKTQIKSSYRKKKTTQRIYAIFPINRLFLYASIITTLLYNIEKKINFRIFLKVSNNPYDATYSEYSLNFSLSKNKPSHQMCTSDGMWNAIHK